MRAGVRRDANGVGARVARVAPPGGRLYGITCRLEMCTQTCCVPVTQSPAMPCAAWREAPVDQKSCASGLGYDIAYKMEECALTCCIPVTPSPTMPCAAWLEGPAGQRSCAGGAGVRHHVQA